MTREGEIGSNEPKKPDLRTDFDWTASPSNLRDTVLVAIGFLYALGVVTWSLSVAVWYLTLSQSIIRLDVLDAKKTPLGLFNYPNRLTPVIDNFLWYVICMALTLNILQWPWKDPQLAFLPQTTTTGTNNTVNYYVKCAIEWGHFVLQWSAKSALYAFPWEVPGY